MTPEAMEVWQQVQHLRMQAAMLLRDMETLTWPNPHQRDHMAAGVRHVADVLARVQAHVRGINHVIDAESAHSRALREADDDK